MSIRRAAAGDLSRVAEIYVFNNRINFFPIFGDESFSFDQLQVVPLADCYFKQPAVLKNLYVYDDGIIRGFVQVDGSELCKVYVDPFFQRRGIGEALLGWRPEVSLEQGIPKTVAWYIENRRHEHEGI